MNLIVKEELVFLFVLYCIVLHWARGLDNTLLQKDSKKGNCHVTVTQCLGRLKRTEDLLPLRSQTNSTNQKSHVSTMILFLLMTFLSSIIHFNFCHVEEKDELVELHLT